MRTLGACVVLAMAASSCGGRAVDFPVADNTPVGDVTVSEAKAICRQIIETVNDEVANAKCIVEGLQALGKGGNCEQAKRECLAEPGALVDIDKACNEVDETSIAKLKQCDLTVGEYENCINDMVDDVRGASSGVSCSMSLEAFSKLKPPTTPASCTAIVGRCPDIDINVPGASGGGANGVP